MQANQNDHTKYIRFPLGFAARDCMQFEKEIKSAFLRNRLHFVLDKEDSLWYDSLHKRNVHIIILTEVKLWLN